jgi:lipopolysaccharide export LptBFGC system permease protein LptF
MGIQMKERLGRDGMALDRAKLSKQAWVSLPEGLLRANIAYGPPPVLHDVAIFRRDRDGHLQEVDTAPIATSEGASQWVLSNGQYWSEGHKQKLAVGTASRQIMQPFQERRVTLTVDPLWLSWYNLVPQYVPLPVLAKLAASDTIPDAHGQYATRFYIVLADAVLPAAMALFAASLALMLLPYATPATSLIIIAFSGYTAHFLIKAGLIMGQNGFIPPLLAGFTVPALLLLATAITLSRCGRQRRRFSDG